MCTVCGLPGKRLEAVDGSSPGNACSVECAAMVFVRWPADQQDYQAWEWRRRWHDVRGVPFIAPPPGDETDRKLMAWLNANPKAKAYFERKS